MSISRGNISLWKKKFLLSNSNLLRISRRKWSIVHHFDEMNLEFSLMIFTGKKKHKLIELRFIMLFDFIINVYLIFYIHK